MGPKIYFSNNKAWTVGFVKYPDKSLCNRYFMICLKKKADHEIILQDLMRREIL
jgi:isocitrate dehydrogenase kinase/phosphatase